MQETDVKQGDSELYFLNDSPVSSFQKFALLFSLFCHLSQKVSNFKRKLYALFSILSLSRSFLYFLLGLILFCPITKNIYAGIYGKLEEFSFNTALTSKNAGSLKIFSKVQLRIAQK